MKTELKSNVCRCHLAIIKDDDDLYSVIVMNLPGAGSSGPTEDEAVARVREAVVGVIQSYIDNSREIPWLSPDEYTIPEGAKEKWISVNA